jgi:hypothetical protein
MPVISEIDAFDERHWLEWVDVESRVSCEHCVDSAVGCGEGGSVKHIWSRCNRASSLPK